MNNLKKFMMLMAGGGFNPDTYFDVLNLQSNSASNFTLISGTKVSQWNDLSGNNNHAVQATDANRPLYNSGEILWDGSNDNLALTNEYSGTTQSIYVTFKKTAVNAVSSALFGSDGPGNNFFRFDGNDTVVARQATFNMVDRPPTANFTGAWRLGGEELYSILSFRRSGGTITVKINDRTCIQGSLNANITNPTFIKYIGSGLSSLYYGGIIRSFSIVSTSLSDAIDTQIKTALYSRYNILSSAQTKFVALGDSITQGGSVPTSFPSYVQNVSTLMSIPYVNLGIAGWKASDALATYQARAISRPYLDKVYIMFGANDIIAGVTASTFAGQIETMVNGFLAAGYNVRNIMISSPCYQSAGANAATLDAYASAVLAKSVSLGCRYADILTYMRNNGADTLMGDSLHPNSSGNTAIGTVINAAFAGA